MHSRVDGVDDLIFFCFKFSEADVLTIYPMPQCRHLISTFDELISFTFECTVEFFLM